MQGKEQDHTADGFSRRGFLKGTSLGIAAGALAGEATAAPATGKEAGRDAEKLAADGEHKVSMELNGEKVEAKVQTGHTLLETLRDQLDKTGTKLVCDKGNCGACTVLIDGQPTNSCLVLALDADGTKVETIEGLAQDGKLHPVQEAFVEEDALQCGFCTPGMVMSCKALLDENKFPTREDAQDALSGNICRCGTYFNIFRAVDRAAKTMREGR